MDATISEKSSVQAFHLFLTITKLAIEEQMIVSTVEEIVITTELKNTLQKSILLMASGKFFVVKPCFPMSARGLEVISALVLNTLITTRRKGETNRKNNITRTTSIMACTALFFFKAFSESFIMLPPLLSYRYRPGSHRLWRR